MSLLCLFYVSQAESLLGSVFSVADSVSSTESTSISIINQGSIASELSTVKTILRASSQLDNNSSVSTIISSNPIDSTLPNEPITESVQEIEFSDTPKSQVNLTEGKSITSIQTNAVEDSESESEALESIALASFITNELTSPVQEESNRNQQSITSTEATMDTEFKTETEVEVREDSLDAFAIDVSPIEILENHNSTNNSEVLSTNASNSTDIDECHFMSFEEWKKLKKEADVVQSELQQATNTSKNTTKHKFKNKNSTSKELSIRRNDSTNSTDIESLEHVITPEEGRVYKDRFNYASSGCGANIIKTNSEAKGASAILAENKDSYLLNRCSASNRFVVIELCQEILVDSVVVGNFEFFSSMFKEVRVSVSDKFPTTNWRVLGEFEAENVRDVQTFKIQNPLIWARYFKLEVLSHYGDEFYCPITLVRVHGKTMMEEVKENEESSQTQDEDEELLIDTTTLNQFDNDTLDECRVFMPHLGLNEFLLDFISTVPDYCDIKSNEQEQVHTTEAHTTTQESVYRTIMNRLSLLESNATLSLLYIEEQSKLLSTAFTNLERRQSMNFESLIDSVNSTLINQLINFKDSYLLMHSEYAKLYKLQELNHQDLLSNSKQKLGSLGNELTFQKRMAVFNTIIILCLLVYVIVTRDAYISEELGGDIRRALAGTIAGRGRKNKRPHVVGFTKKPKSKKKKSEM